MLARHVSSLLGVIVGRCLSLDIARRRASSLDVMRHRMSPLIIACPCSSSSLLAVERRRASALVARWLADARRWERPCLVARHPALGGGGTRSQRRFSAADS